MRHLALVAAIALIAPLSAGDAPPPAAEPAEVSPPAETAPAAAPETEAETLRKQVSYLVGMRLKTMVDRAVQDGELDQAEIMRGLSEAQAGTAVEPDQAMQQHLFESYDAQLQAKRSKGAEGMNTDNEAFLAENAKKPGVQTTASGLQYEVLSKGPEGGKQPTAANTVRVHYTGTKRDGSIFDSSVQRGEPAEFPLAGVIKGWTEGVQLMHEGDKFRFTIPSDLAYGANAPPAIGPNAVLIFEVELLKIVK